jgi:hypothetical protein
MERISMKMRKCKFFKENEVCEVMKGKKVKPQMYRAAPGEEPVYIGFENMCTDHACRFPIKRKKYTWKDPLTKNRGTRKCGVCGANLQT